MSADLQLEEMPLVVTVWHQQGCGHCAEFLPRVQEIALRYSSCVPTALLDTQDNDALSDALHVTATPTVIVLRFGRTMRRFDRGMEDDELEKLYATVGQACARIVE